MTPRSESRDPGEVLFGRTRRAVLGWLFGHADERFFLREIARNVDLPASQVQRELKGLSGAGLVTREVDGRQVYFQANRESFVFQELQSLLAKTVGAVSMIRDSLRRLGDQIEVAWIFGSFVRSSIRKESDIDVLVIGSASFADVVGAVSDPQRKLGREINPVVYTPDEFATKLAAGHHFVTSVMAEPKQFVIGDENGLGRLAQERMAASAQDERGRSRPAPRRRRPGPRRRSGRRNK